MRRMPAVPVALCWRVVPIDGVIHNELAQHREEALGEGHFNQLAFTGVLAVPKCHHDGHCPLHTGYAVTCQ